MQILSRAHLLLSPTEQAFLNGTRQFIKPQIRYIKCRLKKKLRLLNEERKRCSLAATVHLYHYEGRVKKPSEAYYVRASLSEKSALVAQPGRAKVS